MSQDIKEKIPENKIAELYDVIHFFRIGVETQRKIVKDSRETALNFFDTWKDMSHEEAMVLDEIQSSVKKHSEKEHYE